jgi:hypothetical protein
LVKIEELEREIMVFAAVRGEGIVKKEGLSTERSC